MACQQMRIGSLQNIVQLQLLSAIMSCRPVRSAMRSICSAKVGTEQMACKQMHIDRQQHLQDPKHSVTSLEQCQLPDVITCRTQVRTCS
jgi:hypothetical protein